MAVPSPTPMARRPLPLEETVQAPVLVLVEMALTSTLVEMALTLPLVEMALTTALTVKTVPATVEMAQAPGLTAMHLCVPSRL